MKESSMITPLGKGERIGNQTIIFIVSILAFLPTWISSTGFEHPLILASFVSAAHGQQESPSSQASTPFLEWYRTQKTNQEITNPLSVKITSPTKGQQVPSGQSLIVSGVSSDNSTSDCKVSVIVNGEKPYQPAIASGTGGINDYSAWKFMIKPTSTTIGEGSDNKITSKLECAPDLTKWYSVNVTGVGTTAPLDRAGAVFLSNDNNPDGNLPLGSPNTGTLSTEAVARPTSPSLLISVNAPSDPVTIGDDETLEATVIDSVSRLRVNNAILEVEVTDSSGNPIDESSENDGDLSYTLDEAADSDSTVPGTFTATLRASAEGYEPESKTVTFDLVEEADDESENVEPSSGEGSDSDEGGSDNDINEPLSSGESDSNEDIYTTDIGELFR
jgi:hypothetical protein